jgi:hypothetical protein
VAVRDPEIGLGFAQVNGELADLMGCVDEAVGTRTGKNQRTSTIGETKTRYLMMFFEAKSLTSSSHGTTTPGLEEIASTSASRILPPSFSACSIAMRVAARTSACEMG